MSGCGCKNNQPQPQTVQQPQTTTSPKNSSIQEAVKKVVEKYYNKK